jgi:hypothetical protein
MAMKKYQAIAAAKADAKANRTALAVVEDQMAETPEAPYGYCPMQAVTLLFPRGRVIGTVSPGGTFSAVRAVRIEANPEAKYECERWLVYFCPTARTKQLLAMTASKVEALAFVAPGWPVEVIER